MWTRHHDKLERALEVATFLEPMRRSLRLESSSALADVHLLRALLGANQLKPALRQLENGDQSALLREVLERLPRRLPAEIVHHVALAWRGHRDERLARMATRSLLFLIDRQRGYLESIGEKAHCGADETRLAIEGLLPEVLETELAAIRAVGGSDEDRDRAELANDRLDDLSEAVATDAISATGAGALARLRLDAAEVAVGHVLARIGEAADHAQTKRVEGTRNHLRQVFESALGAVELIGHHEVLSVEVVTKALEMAWPLHQSRESQAVTDLLAPIEPFIDDIGARIARDEAFGQQGHYADYWVMRSQATETVDPRTRLTIQRRYLRRALAVCPIHRNTRVCLAVANINLARLIINEAKTGLSKKGRQAKLDQARRLIDEARSLRPEQSGLAEVTTLLEEAGG